MNRPRRAGWISVAACSVAPRGMRADARRVSARSDGASSSARRDAQGSAPRVAHGPRDLGRGAERHRAGQGALDGQLPGRRSEQGVDERDHRQRDVDRHELDEDPAAGHHEQHHRRQCGHEGEPARRDHAPTADLACRGGRHRQRGTGGGEDAVEDAVDGGALELELGAQLHAVPQARLDHGLHLVGGDERPAGEPRPRLGRVQDHGRPAGRHAERDRRRGAGRPGQLDDVREHRRVDADVLDLGAGGGDVGRGGHRADARGGRVVRVEAAVVAGEHLLLLRRARVAHRQLEQEAVELRLGQRVGALVLDRVLRGDDDERVGQRVRVALDGHLPLLHRLEQRGLRLRRRAVDLVGQQHVGEHRTRGGSGTRRRRSGRRRG